MKRLNIVSPCEFENDVKEQPIVSGLVVKEISRNFLVKLHKEVNMANIIGPKKFEKEVYEESVMSFLVVIFLGDSLVELPKEVSAMSREFQDSFHFEFPSLCLTSNFYPYA
jgi:hypothetical protein